MQKRSGGKEKLRVQKLSQEAGYLNLNVGDGETERKVQTHDLIGKKGLMIE